MSTTKSIMAFMLGAAAGGAAALILAPTRGEETRTKIRSRYDEGAQKLEKSFHHLGETVQDYEETAKDRAHDLGDRLRNRKGAVKEALAEGKAAYRREVERGRTLDLDPETAEIKLPEPV